MSRSRLRGLFAILFLSVCQNALAVPIEDAPPKCGEKIGVFLATFDPPSLTHTAAIQQALVQGHLSRIVVVPTDFTPHKWYRTDTRLRHEMLTAAYREDPKVLTISEGLYGYPQSRGLIHELKESGVIVSGIVLAEDLTSSLSQRVIHWLLPARRWVVLPSPQATVQGSSSAIRRYFERSRDYFGLSEQEISEIPADELPLSLPVRQIIRETGLYKKNTRGTYCGFVTDCLRAYYKSKLE